MLGPRGRFPERRLIVGMNSLDEFFGSGQTIPWIKTQNPVAFLRPMPDVGVGTPGPTAGVAQLLRFRRYDSLLRRDSSARLRSSMSVPVPYHLTIFPVSSRSGTLRCRNQWYSPSARLTRDSATKASPDASAARHLSTNPLTSSG